MEGPAIFTVGQLERWQALGRRVAWANDRPPVQDRGISERALQHIGRLVGAAQHADPALFARNGDGDKDARRHLRFLAALVPDTVPDDRLHVAVCDIVCNPNLDPETVRDALYGVGQVGQAGGEVDGWTLRKVGILLRDGMPQRKIREQTGVNRETIAALSSFLGVADARRERLRDAAADHLEDGGSVFEFAAQHDMSEQKAQELLDDVAAGLEL